MPTGRATWPTATSGVATPNSLRRSSSRARHEEAPAEQHRDDADAGGIGPAEVRLEAVIPMSTSSLNSSLNSSSGKSSENSSLNSSSAKGSSVTNGSSSKMAGVPNPLASGSSVTWMTNSQPNSSAPPSSSGLPDPGPTT